MRKHTSGPWSVERDIPGDFTPFDHDGSALLHSERELPRSPLLKGDHEPVTLEEA